MKCFSNLIIIITLASLSDGLFAQERIPREASLIPSFSYVSENWRGNLGFAVGLKLGKPINNRLSWEGGLTYFSTGIVGINQNAVTFEGEERYYNSLILTPNLSYRFAGTEGTKYSATVRLGPSLKYFSYKDFSSGTVRINPDGSVVPAPGAVMIYNEKQGFNVSFFGALSIDRKFSEKFGVGIFLDTYSSGNAPLEYLMPGICFTLSLNHIGKNRN